MGIGGHILGAKKLRRLAAKTGLPLDRAYIRGSESEGVVWAADRCRHYRIDTATGDHEEIVDATHWASCRADMRPDVDSGSAEST